MPDSVLVMPAFVLVIPDFARVSPIIACALPSGPSSGNGENAIFEVKRQVILAGRAIRPNQYNKPNIHSGMRL